MANELVTIQEVLSGAALPVASAAGSGLTDQLDGLTRQLGRLQSATEAGIASTAANTRAVELLPVVGGGGNGIGSVLGSSLLSSLGGGLGSGLSPLISGIARLFGGGDSNEPPPLARFELPPSVGVNAGVSAAIPGGAFAVDQGQGGLPRPVTANPAPTQVTVQVQAMDSQSFLDRSGDIALAVRQAMLESGVLNDVIRGV